MLRAMTERKVNVSLELSLADRSLRGRAIYGAGTVRAFSGLVGLIGVIDALIEEAREGRLELDPERAQTKEGS